MLKSVLCTLMSASVVLTVFPGTIVHGTEASKQETVECSKSTDIDTITRSSEGFPEKTESSSVLTSDNFYENSSSFSENYTNESNNLVGETTEKKEPSRKEKNELKKESKIEDDQRTVSDWNELKIALTDQNISKIVVTQDITADSVGPEIDHVVEIEFNGNELNMASRYITLTETGSLTLSNFVLNGNDGQIVQGKGELILKGIISSATNNQMGFADMDAGTVLFDGVQMNYDKGASANPAVTAKNFTINNQSHIVSEAIKFYRNDNKASDGAQIVINNNSYVETNSVKGDNANGQVWDVQRQSDIFVKGNSQLVMTGDIYDTGSSGGLFVIGAAQSSLNVEDASTLKIHSKRSPAIVIESKGGSFNVKNHSNLELISDGQKNSRGATLRFRLTGEMTFNVEEESKINITKTAEDAPAIRMRGGKNIINVRSGSDFNIINKGNGSPTDPGTNGGNQGIQFDTGGDNVFNLSGENSSVLINAKNGAAIDSKDYSLAVNAEEGTYFVARGNTSSAKSGIFNAGTLSFNMDKVKYFDFRNNCSAGGLIIENNTGSNFASNDSDVSVWTKNSDLDGDPKYAWFDTDFEMTGANFNTLTSTSNSEMQTNFGTLENYSRMSANNQTAVIDDLRVPTNADKYIFAHAQVPEAKNEFRDAYTDEVLLKVAILDVEGNQVDTVSGTSIGTELSVYGDETRKGLFKIDAPKKEFLKEGYTLKVLEAWRGENKESSQWFHQSSTEDIQTKSELVYDVTPPSPAKIDGDVTTVSVGTKQLSGKAEPDSNVFIYLNDQDTGLSTQTDALGKFQISLPNSLKKDDAIQIFLQDKSGIAEIINPPITNTAVGNIQPKEELVFHDATFQAAVQLIVEGALEFVSPEIIDFGVRTVSNMDQKYTPNVTGKLEVTDTRGVEKKSWKLFLRENEGVHSEQYDLSGLMTYKNQKVTQEINNDFTLIEENQLKEDGSEIISDQWNKDYGLHMVVPVEKQLIGDYQGTLEWQLQDTPENN